MSGINTGVALRDITSVFTAYGSVERCLPRGKNSFVVQFESIDGAHKSLRLNQKMQPGLKCSRLSVTLLDLEPRPKFSPFVTLDNPKFNNYFIPVLPQALHP